MPIVLLLPMLLLSTALGPRDDAALEDPVQKHVSEVHAQSIALRRKLLTAWTFEADATPSPGYYSTFAAAPIQHIIAAMALNENQTAVELAQVALANPNMSSHFGATYEWTCVARAFAMFNSKSSWRNVVTMHARTEESIKNMSFLYAVKNCGGDKFCGGVAPSKGGGSMCTSGSENLDYDAKSSCYIALRELSKFPEYKDRPLGVPAPPVPPGPQHLARCNHCCKAGCGLKCCSDPPPAPQKCCCLARVKTPDKCPSAPPAPPAPALLTVSEAAAEWDRFFYNKLRDQALSGLFSENGSPNYWYRTWPAIFNLADLASPRVRQRAKMFIDLAFVEGESFQVGGFRGGAKMRAKKDGGEYPVYNAHGNTSDSTSSVVVYQAGMGRCAGDALKPVLLGLGGPPVWKYKDGESFNSPPVWWPHFASVVIEMLTSRYNMSATVIMRRACQDEKTCEGGGEMTVRNRLLGEGNDTHPSAGLSLNSSIVHNYYATTSFGLGSIYFNPAKIDSIGAPPQESMIELVFANAEHSTVGLPHTSGPKWAAQQGSAMIAAQCSGSLGCIARYAGNFATEVYNVSRMHAGSGGSSDVYGGWIFIEPAVAANTGHHTDDPSSEGGGGGGGSGDVGWGAVYLVGGLNASASSVTSGVAGSGNRSFLLVPNDPWSPVVLFAGNASTFGSFQGFVEAVVGAELDIGVPTTPGGPSVVNFTPPAGKHKPCPMLCKKMVFPFGQNKTAHKAPTIGGRPVEDQPAMAYDGPLMQSLLGSQTVRVSSGGGGDAKISEIYDFSKDTIQRV